MKLTKEGLVKEKWIPRQEFEEKGHYEETVERPDNFMDFLKYWYEELGSIESGYTLGDLFKLLEYVDGNEIIGHMCHMDLGAFLDQAKEPPEVHDYDLEIEYLEVSNTTELSTYVPDPNMPDEHISWVEEDIAENYDKVQEAVADLTGEKKPNKIAAYDEDEITGKAKSIRMIGGAMHGKWVGPYWFRRNFHGWGRWGEPYKGAIDNDGWDPDYKGGISISLTPVNELLDLELRYNPKITFSNDKYGKQAEILLDTTIDITFGDFVHAILWEIGWHGPPEEKKEFKEELNRRSENLKDLHDEE